MMIRILTMNCIILLKSNLPLKTSHDFINQHTYMSTYVCMSDKNKQKKTRRKEKKQKQNHEVYLGIFTNNSSFTTHHFSILSCISIECWTHNTGHLIIISKTSPHDTAKTILFNYTPLTWSEIIFKRKIFFFSKLKKKYLR